MQLHASKRRVLHTLRIVAAVVWVFAAAGCGRETPDAPPEPDVHVEEETHVVPPPVPEAAPSEVPPEAVPATPVDAEPDAPPEEIDPLHAALLGTRWQVGDMLVVFRAEDEVFVQGGPVAELAPDGLEATYRYADGVVTASAMGRTMTGVWDGETLVVEGVPAQRRDTVGTEE